MSQQSHALHLFKWIGNSIHTKTWTVDLWTTQVWTMNVHLHTIIFLKVDSRSHKTFICNCLPQSLWYWIKSNWHTYRAWVLREAPQNHQQLQRALGLGKTANCPHAHKVVRLSTQCWQKVGLKGKPNAQRAVPVLGRGPHTPWLASLPSSPYVAPVL